ncbi:hypothetical protein [Kitasatospora purpeofusca]|uniref:hypothetical protein n=1 Tax=Kitasatospora purpeofusca TaxID=67352 RepID=UPI002E1666C8|nr:hypothetical protein OG715_04085 [Kitasatospora purpeofusca]WSR38437.1 hypothetical protein OG196_04690 [Kitasatospora purpeofusca]
MTEFQVISDDPRNRRLSGAAEEALLRRLLHGTVFDPESGAPATTEAAREPEERRTSSAHCRHAMYYED